MDLLASSSADSWEAVPDQHGNTGFRLNYAGLMYHIGSKSQRSRLPSMEAFTAQNAKS